MTSWIFVEARIIDEWDHNIFSILKIPNELYIKILQCDKDGKLTKFTYENGYERVTIKTIKKIPANDLQVLKKYHKFNGKYYSSYYNLNIFKVLKTYILYYETGKIIDHIKNISKEILSEINYNYLDCFILEEFSHLNSEAFYNNPLAINIDVKKLNSNLKRWKNSLEILKNCKFPNLDSNILCIVQEYLLENKFITINLDIDLWMQIKKHFDKIPCFHNNERKFISFINPKDLMMENIKRFGNISIETLIAINHQNLKPVINYIHRWNLKSVDII